ncbi:MAG: hypothetical protein CMQ20_04655 [Gammaproteobacteria bacterium]|jgi:ribonuclease BN (tRNA processing enzyme)|nr:hypothetical protein [Gammaproteobacteria bacterium]
MHWMRWRADVIPVRSDAFFVPGNTMKGASKNFVGGVVARLVCCAALVLQGAFALGDSGAMAHYLANEGVMVVHGDTKVLFDPLFSNGYGRYQSLPENMKQALFAGEAPYEGVDAVFVSHSHQDHFSPIELLKFLRLRRDVMLYAPAQAVDELKTSASAADDAIFNRVTGIQLEYGDEPIVFKTNGLIIEAVYIPHSG